MADLYLRHANRYEVTAPVSYWWSSPKGPVHSAAGETRNISHSGVLVAAGECPPIGSAIQMTIQLPRLRGGGFGMKLQGEEWSFALKMPAQPLNPSRSVFSLLR